jgi:hypothetical protein
VEGATKDKEVATDIAEDMKITYSSFEKEILRSLFERGDWLDLYQLHQEYLLSPGQLSYAVRKFVHNEIIEVEGLLVRLTEHGQKWVFAHRREIFLADRNRYWAEPSDHKMQTPMPVTQPYLPKLNKANLKFLNNR